MYTQPVGYSDICRKVTVHLKGREGHDNEATVVLRKNDRGQLEGQIEGKLAAVSSQQDMEIRLTIQAFGKVQGEFLHCKEIRQLQGRAEARTDGKQGPRNIEALQVSSQ